LTNAATRSSAAFTFVDTSPPILYPFAFSPSASVRHYVGVHSRFQLVAVYERVKPLSDSLGWLWTLPVQLHHIGLVSGQGATVRGVDASPIIWRYRVKAGRRRRLHFLRTCCAPPEVSDRDYKSHYLWLLFLEVTRRSQILKFCRAKISLPRFQISC
jgi:hypothetical protein